MRTIGLSLLFLSACSTGVDRNVESKVTITTGVYGQTTEVDDVGTHPSPTYHTMQIELQHPDSAPVASATSGEQGFYELAAEPADYRICTTFGRCLAITVVAGQRLRCDYEFSIGPGWDCQPER
jgi:hypothetical protein